jgi:uncharacterized DUF497 family protein
MRISFDPEKRLAILAQRGLDFADAAHVFAGETATLPDHRQDYGEVRYITAGWLGSRLVVMVWTPRGDGRALFR